MPLLDQSGEVVATVLGKQTAERAIEAGIAGGGGNGFRDPVHEKFFLSLIIAFVLECVNDSPSGAVCITNHGV